MICPCREIIVDREAETEKLTCLEVGEGFRRDSLRTQCCLRVGTERKCVIVEDVVGSAMGSKEKKCCGAGMGAQQKDVRLALSVPENAYVGELDCYDRREL